MTAYESKEWVLKGQVGNDIDTKEVFTLVTKKYRESDLGENQVLAKTLYLSNDPTQRLWISSHWAPDRIYKEPIKEGARVDAGAVLEVIASKNPDYSAGDLIYSYSGWAEYRILNAASISMKVQGDPTDTITLGLTGLTAYFGALEVGKMSSNDHTVVVSGAAGSTGSIVCQIAKNVLGIKNVVGIAGTEEKCKMLKEKCGCDIALNYKSPRFKQDLIDATPNYINCYFDNVGGEILDLCLSRMAEFGRVVACGAISSYDNVGKQVISAENWMLVMFMKIRIEGFIVIQFLKDFGRAFGDLMQWMQEGKVTLLKTVWEAPFEVVPNGMTRLLQGNNVGKLVTKIV